MKRLLIASLFVLVGCGGGGGGSSAISNPTAPTRTDTLNVPANAAASNTFGADTLTVAPATFPAGASLTLKQYDPSSLLSPPANKKLTVFNVGVLSATADPILPLNASVNGGGSHQIVAYRDPNNPTIWHWSNDGRVNGNVSFQLLNQPSGLVRPASIVGDIRNGWNWLVANIVDDLPDTDQSTPLLLNSSTSNSSGRIVMVVHGIMDNVGSITDLANYCHSSFGAYLTYGVPYHYMDDGGAAATLCSQQLSSVLNTHTNPVTLILHSRGGLIGRYALEHYIATNQVSDCVVINSPNTGANLADSAQNLQNDLDAFLNDPFSLQPTQQYETSNAVTDMAAGSSFLTRLNTPRFSDSTGPYQRPYTNYYFLAGDQDIRVPLTSALATTVPMEEVTAGAIDRHVMVGAKHGDIKTDPARMAEMANFVKGHSNASMSVSLQDSAVDASVTCWNYTVIVTNNSGNYLPLHDITLADYDAYGNAMDTWWYNPGLPPDQFFSGHFIALDSTDVLAPYATKTYALTCYADSNKDQIALMPPQYQCGTTVITVRATVNQERQAVRGTVLTRHLGSIWPSSGPTFFLRKALTAPRPAAASKR